MKLFLSSLAISPETIAAFEALVGKDISSIKMALSENAADVYDEKDKRFVYDTRTSL